MFKKLKRQNKDKEFEWTKNDDKVMHAIEVGDIEKLQITLAKKGTSPTKLDGEGRTPLHVAAQKGQYPCLEVLLQLGANPRASDGQGCTALHCASKGGHLNSMHRLIKAGVPINAQDFNGKTALHFSAGSGHIESTILLLQCGASIDIADEYGKTPLMVAASSGHVGVCRDLIDRRANVNSQDHIQKTPLMAACENGNKETVELLIKRGARVDLCDAQGYDAKYYAEGSGQDDMAEILEKAPSVASWDVRNEEEEAYDEVAPDAVDYIDTFEVGNERADSPPPNKNHQNNISADFPTPSRAVSMPALVNNQTDELKELEEENDFLNEELSKVNVAHKKALERIRSLESKANEIEQVDSLKQRLENEEAKRKEAENDISDLKNKLSSMKLKESKDSFEEDEVADRDETNSVGSWGDSEDDLFDLPGTKKSPRKALNISLDINSSKHKSDMQHLKTEVETLRKENENLKNQLESDEMTPAGTVSRAEFERLRLSSNGRIADLEEELASLKEELEEMEAGNMIPYQEYQELKEVNEEELSVVKLENIVLKDEIGNISQRLAEMTDRKERLQEQVIEQQELQLRPVSSSSADFRFNEICQEKLELEEIISKHSEVLAEQADDIERYKKEIEGLMAERSALEARLTEGSASGGKEEMEALKKENDRLQIMIGKQSKAIAQQTDRMRKDKIKYSELAAERDRLANEMQASQRSGVNGDGELEERQELEKENRRLMERVGMLERRAENEEERTRVEELTAENWRLQDAVRKVEDEMLVKSAQLSKLHAVKGGDNLQEENRKLKDRNREMEIELSNRRDGEAQYSQILAENLSLKTRLSQLGDSGHQNGSVDSKVDILAENKRLKETIKHLEGTKNGGLMNGIDGGGGEGGGKANLKEVSKLKHLISEMDARHRETVNIYRAHLLSAVQDEISPEVKEALQQIVKLRNETPVT